MAPSTPLPPRPASPPPPPRPSASLARAPSPLSSVPTSAYNTPAALLTPTDTAPPSPSTATPKTTTAKPRPRRNVQWNELVAAHVTIPFYSEAAPDDAPSTDDGHDSVADSAPPPHSSTTLARLAAAHHDPFSDQWRLDDVPLALAGGQDDGALNGGSGAPVVQVWVDPLERDGLPSAAALEGGDGALGANESEDKAQGLVSAYARGAVGLWEGLRQRRASISAMRHREEDEDEKGTRPDDELHSPVAADGAAPALDVTPGILGALFALQQQEAALASRGDDSASSSAVPTPAPSTPSSPSLHPLTTSSPLAHDFDLDSSDDEVERERFIAKLRAKRATKNALHAASHSVAKTSKHAAGAALRFAVGGKGERGRTMNPAGRPHSYTDRSGSQSRASSPTASSPALSPARRPASVTSSASGGADSRAPSSPALSAHDRTRSSASLVQLKSDAPPSTSAGQHPTADLSARHRSHSHNTLSRLVSHASASPPASPASPSPASPSSPTALIGVAVPHKPKLTSEFNRRVRKVGDRLGLEWETSRTRPNAASSRAGVFGGLMLGATALAGPASPSGTRVAPLSTRPGYNLSRYSAPDVNETTRASPKPSSSALPSPPAAPPSRRTLSPPPSTRLSPPHSPGAMLKASPTPSRKSLSDMVREEEEKDHGGAGEAGEPTLRERRRQGRRAIFSLHVNDLPAAGDEDAGEPTSASPRPTLTIDTSAPGSTRSHSPSPTSAGGTLRFFGPRSPRSAPSSFSSLHRDYFGGGALSPTLTPAERERERAQRKAREDTEREAKEREQDLRAWHKEKRRRRKAREKELKRRRVFIKEHVAAILERQQFILKLARAFMMFGAPSHRLEAQIQATARVLELPHCTAMYLPGVLLVNFGDPATCTSDIKFLKQAAGLDLGKLKAAYYVYNKVIRDKVSVADAATQLDDLMTSPPKYGLVKNVVIGGLAGAFIMPSAFNGSFIDCLAAIPLGGLLVLVQVLLARNDMYSSLFEIVIACINAMVAGSLTRTNQFCFYAVASGSIVLILPGFITLCAALELANRSITSGAVRLTYAALYCLFLGFGLSLGAEIYVRVARAEIINGADYTCSYLRAGAPWWRQTIPRWWYFLTIPSFLLCMALKNGQPLFRRDTLAMVVIGSAGFSANYFSGREFQDQPALSSLIGSFVVGILGNTWSRLTRESAFVSMVVGIFVQLPSGLANGGLLRFAADSSNNGQGYGTAIDAAAGLITIVIGMTVGLFIAAAVMNLISRRGRRRGAHLSTF
ncbi:hypothetical protein JCM9279_001736 [Rhodotorula babjevae]